MIFVISSREREAGRPLRLLDMRSLLYSGRWVVRAVDHDSTTGQKIDILVVEAVVFVIGNVFDLCSVADNF